MKNRKRSRHLLIGFIILFLLLCLYFILQKTNSENEDAAEEETISLTDISANTISSFSFISAGSTLSFVKEEETWYYEEDRDFPVLQDTAATMASAFETVEATRKLEDVKSLEEYGLADPGNVITVTDSDGMTMAFYIGNQNATTGDYYAYIDDPSVVYMITESFPTAFAYGLYDLADADEFPTISASSITHLAVAQSDNTFELTATEEYAGSSWAVSDNEQEQTAANDSLVSELLTSIESLAFSSTVDYSSDSLQDYGLDNPTAMITIDYAETSEESSDDSDSAESETITVQKQLELSIGNQDEEGNYYVITGESNQVHTMTADSLASLLGVETNAYLNLYMSYVPLEDLQELIVTYEGNAYRLRAQITEETDDDGGAAASTAYYLDDQEVASDAFTTFYSAAYLLSAESISPEPVETNEAPAISLQFTKTDGTQVTVDYTPYDSSYYIGKNSDGDYGMVNKMNVKNLIEKFEAILN